MAIVNGIFFLVSLPITTQLVYKIGTVFKPLIVMLTKNVSANNVRERRNGGREGGRTGGRERGRD